MAKVKVLLDSDNCFHSDADDSLVDDDASQDSRDIGGQVVDDDSHADDNDDDDSHAEDNDDDSHADDDDDDSDADDDDSRVDDDDKPTEDPVDSSPSVEDETTEASQKQKSGMANVIARILSKDLSNSKRVLLAKGKTRQEIFRDISQRKRQREESENANVKTKHPKKEKLHDVAEEEKRKLWESMGRRIPSVLDNPREVRLRKIATQGMVQLFRLVSQAKMQG